MARDRDERDFASVMDVMFSAELDRGGDPWPSMTVYYARRDLPRPYYER